MLDIAKFDEILTIEDWPAAPNAGGLGKRGSRRKETTVYERVRILWLILIMMAVAVVVGGATIGILYNIAIDEERVRLAGTAASQARLIEAVARFSGVDKRNFKTGPMASALTHLRDGHEDYMGFGRTGEFMLAGREGGNIVFILGSRHSNLDPPKPVALASDLAEPMRRALSGNSGTLIGLDYRGVTVLAAHEPVATLDMGIVAKIDLAEIRGPFMRAGGAMIAIVLVLIVTGILLVARVGNPTIRNLQASERRFQALAKVSPVGVFYTDRDGRFQYVNEAWCALTGLDPTAAKRDWLQQVHPGDRQMVAREWGECIHGDRSFMAEFRFLHSGGAVSWVIGQATAQTGEGPEIVGYVGTLTDVTELKDTENKLRQAQKMEAVGQLTGGIAHDFNNILAVVMGNLEFLEELLEGDERAAKILQRAVGGVQRGAGLTERLLAFSRKQHLEPELLDITDVISRIVDILRRTLGETISVQTAFAGDLSPVMADRSQLENVILNLAVNSRDAMPDGGFFIVDAQNITIIDRGATEYEFLRPGRYAIVAVSDTGTGMPPEVVSRVFDPFFTTKGAGMGSGLGLSMVYGFVKQSEGYVTVDSREGHGTTVKLYLPAADEREVVAAEGVGDDKTNVGGDETILVVEDESEVRSLAVDMLGSLGYTVLEAEDGRRALEVLDHAPRVDLLFTDVVMPGGLSGDDLAREAIRRTRGIKVLFTSGYPADHLGGGKSGEGTAKLLRKPYTRRELAETVRLVLESGTSGRA
jgi:PAS domain S-box-containing protein